jgi:hypothetical protein
MDHLQRSFGICSLQIYLQWHLEEVLLARRRAFARETDLFLIVAFWRGRKRKESAISAPASLP